MTTSSLLDGYIQTENYYAGRIRPIRATCLHTAECPCEPGRAKFIMEFLQPASRRASAHAAVDAWETWGGCQEESTAWAAPSLNADGLHLEQAAYAGWDSEWNDPVVKQMLNDKSIPIMADWHRRYNLPPTILTPTELLNPNAKGMTHHVFCSQAFGGTHWDCGPNYDLQYISEGVARILFNENPQPAPEFDEERMHIFQERDSTTIWIIRNGKKCRLTEAFSSAQQLADAGWPAWQAWLNEWYQAGVLAQDPMKPIPLVGWQAMWLIPNGPVDGS